MAEKNVMQMLYDELLPVMKQDGIKDTPANRHAYLIGVRAAYKVSETFVKSSDDYITDVLTAEIIRLGDELPI